MKTKKVSREEEARRERVLYWTVFVIAINIPQLFFKNIFIVNCNNKLNTFNQAA